MSNKTKRNLSSDEDNDVLNNFKERIEEIEYITEMKELDNKKLKKRNTKLQKQNEDLLKIISKLEKQLEDSPDHSFIEELEEANEKYRVRVHELKKKLHHQEQMFKEKASEMKTDIKLQSQRIDFLERELSKTERNYDQLLALKSTTTRKQGD